MTLAGPAHEALVRAAGEEALGAGEPLEVDGVSLETWLAPPDGEALGRCLEVLAQHELAALVRGGGSRLDLGNPPRDPALVLSTRRLSGVDDLDPGEGVCHALAGTPLAELAKAAEAAGWELPLDPPGPESTLGGALAAAAFGPRANGFGLPRDLVLGLEVTLASGERTRCGGRVVKNVTGYDLGKLYTGSLGTLGVIEGAWLRLRPRPEAARLFELEAGGLDQACAIGLAAARRATARVAALLPEGEGWRLVCELAGDSPAVAADAEWLGDAGPVREVAGEVLDEVRAAQVATAAGGLRLRVAMPASRLVGVCAALHSAGGALLVYPGLGLVYAGFPAAAAEEACVCAAGAAERAAGSWLIESAPLAVKRGRDVFGDSSQTTALAGALKQRFDPQGVLNPGRFQGRV